MSKEKTFRPEERPLNSIRELRNTSVVSTITADSAVLKYSISSSHPVPRKSLKAVTSMMNLKESMPVSSTMIPRVMLTGQPSPSTTPQKLSSFSVSTRMLWKYTMTRRSMPTLTATSVTFLLLTWYTSVMV